MTEIEILNQMIKAEARLPIKVENGKGSVELKEPGAKDSKVMVTGLPSDAIVFKADMFPPPKAIFSNTRSECKRADYVIISDTITVKCIVYIEMKRTTDKTKDIIAQLKGAACVICYCQAIGRLFWNRSSFLDNFKHRFVFLGRTAMSVRKRPTAKISSSGKNDSPDQVLMLNSHSKILLKMLVGTN